MKEKGKTSTQVKIVDHLPDLIVKSDYLDPPSTKKIRVQISVTKDGVEVLGDSMYPLLAEAVIREVSDDDMERTLCG